jgi:hypothetical protein
LLLAGALGGVSSGVSCTAGCPLPPYEHTTTRDLVHASTSIGAVGFATLAMLIVAIAGVDGRLRRIAQVCFAICAPLLLALAVGLLALGRSPTTAILERVALAGVVAWGIATAVALRTDSDPSSNPSSLRRSAGWARR